MATAKRRSKKPKKRTSKKRTSRKPVAARPPIAAAPARTTIDFDDEDQVLVEMSRALDIPADDLKIKESSAPTGVGNSKVYLVEIAGGKTGKEWYVVENDVAAEELALAYVTEQLENEPENFEPSFIESHIDKERLSRDLWSDVLNSNEERLREDAERDTKNFWHEAEGHGISPKYTVKTTDPDNNEKTLGVYDDEGDAEEAGGAWVDEQNAAHPGAEKYDYDYEVETSDPSDEDIENVAEAQTKAELSDPMEYLENIYGKEDAAKQAIKIAGIDVKAAAEEAVGADGAGHFLSSYDGNLNDTQNGLTYWRHN